MGLVSTDHSSVGNVLEPTNRDIRQTHLPPHRAPEPQLERDFRVEELQQLRVALCRQAPPPSAPYWVDNSIWIGCVSIDLDKTAGSGDFVKMVIKVTTKEDTDDTWKYYLSRKSEMFAAIRANVPAGNIRVSDIKIERGSISVVLIIQITIGLGTLIISVFSSYDNIERNFKRAMPLIKQYAHDLISTFKGFFRGLGFRAT